MRHRPVALVELCDVAVVLVGVVVEEDGLGGFRVLAYASPAEPRGRVGHQNQFEVQGRVLCVHGLGLPLLHVLLDDGVVSVVAAFGHEAVEHAPRGVPLLRPAPPVLRKQGVDNRLERVEL